MEAARAAPQAGDVQASAQLMRLEAGTYCIFHAAVPAGAGFAPLSGMRVTVPPGMDAVRVSTFDADGWMGAKGGAALVRMPDDGGAVLVTTYRDPARDGAALPGLQVVRLSGPQVTAAAAAVPSSAQAAGDVRAGGMIAHIQGRGDVSAALGTWMGKRGGRQWMEGFAIQPAPGLAAGDMEYQAILGADWFSPWVNGGAYCGSRGMALPLLGLRVRLKGEAARQFVCRIEACFTDGTHLGPLEDAPVMASSQAPLEAFRIEILPRQAAALSDPSPEDAAGKAAPATMPPADQSAPSVPRVRRGRRVVPPRVAVEPPALPDAAADKPVPWWHRRPEKPVAAPVTASTRGRSRRTGRRSRTVAQS
ncbi:hypothetical protein LU298_04730 [Komagataeibacter intermedius]|uniref:Uncharacterized protein n=3 Tax=Komagataeibacter intermedius TaxID=66229 RepID=A0A0N1FAI5_9PROT|nr:hypothetical protein [Komagataeibacter intermedius]KPH88072.1 hypothetical protein GLUCOINTEAF2_0201833 [Komagataeibacter intermedius AF2]MCF3635805.1 hypothetical protein [Komagataeibacter intermedius]GAN87104.1 hypothetical protein Gain_0046_039 [Komagataeibacter intermedius TF2]GBQ73869.1 hypothetical protein AA0521_2422 [Komagataeibacter intermedius NRIC 0521]